MPKFLKTVIATGVLAAATVVPSLPAQADEGPCDNPPLSGATTIQSVTPSPTAVVVGLRQPVIQAFTVVVTDSCPVPVSVSNLTSFGGADWQDPVTVLFDNGTQVGNTWTFHGTLTWDPGTLADGAAGEWTPATYAYGSGYDGTYNGSFTVSHATRLSADSSATRVRSGRPVTISGKLRTADWEKHAWAGLAAEAVSLQYKSHNGQWSEIQTGTTDASGKATFTATPATSGCYRLVFAGADGNAAATSAAERVVVRGGATSP